MPAAAVFSQQSAPSQRKSVTSSQARTRPRKRRADDDLEAAISQVSQAFRSTIREELEAYQRHTQEPSQRLIQEPARQAMNTLSHTVVRSQAARAEMQRIPSQFERYEPPQPPRGPQFPGPMEYWSSFPVPGSRPPLSGLIPGVNGGSLGPFPQASQSQVNTIVNEGQEANQPNRRRQNRGPQKQNLRPYERIIQLD